MNHKPEFALRLQGRREPNGVVEGETEGFVNLLATDILEEVLLEILDDGEQGTTRRVCGGVLTAGTCDGASEGSCVVYRRSAIMMTRRRSGPPFVDVSTSATHESTSRLESIAAVVCRQRKEPYECRMPLTRRKQVRFYIHVQSLCAGGVRTI